MITKYQSNNARNNESERNYIMTKKMTVAEKIANKAIKSVGEMPFGDLINQLSDKEALAVAVVQIDREVGKKDFDTWRSKGYSRSKRSMRVMHKLLSQMNSPEADAVLKLKEGYLYSVCKKQNELSTEGYKAVRKSFLPKFDAFLQKLA
jgi:hypothetical protein